jgi:outer membrane protein assembly factor BamD
MYRDYLSSWKSLITLCFLALFLTSCGGSKSSDEDSDSGFFGGLFNSGKEKVRQDPSAETLFGQAEQLRKTGDYSDAAAKYIELERLYPYSELATKAQLLTAWSYFKENRYNDSLLTLDRFIQLHPGHPDVAYAYYMRAQNYYEQITGVKLDQAITLKAAEALKDVIRRYPNSKYAQNARIQFDLTTDQLAGKEMAIGRYYQNLNHNLAALNRFRRVVEDYQTTNHIQEALHRIVETNLALGIVDEAQNAAAVLGHNFPGSIWYRDSYSLLKGQNLTPKSKPTSWLKKTFQKVF